MGIIFGDVERQMEELEDGIDGRRGDKVDFSPPEADSAPIVDGGKKKGSRNLLQ